jgi:hypothetical protein
MRLPWLVLVPSVAFAQTPDEPPVTPSEAATAAPAPPPTDPEAAKHPQGKDIVIHTSGERSQNNVIALWSVAGAGALIGAVGIYYNLDARSNSSDLTATSTAHIPWTPQLQAKYDQAHDSSVKAGVFYGIGGAVILGAIVGAIVTAPKEETTIIHPHVSATAGGAVVGGAWSF